MATKKLKDWFDKDLAVLLSEKIKVHDRSFDSRRFIREVAEGTKNLELKNRVELIADQLQANLSPDFKQAINICRQILGPELKKETGMFTEGYWLMPVAKYVEKYGIDHFSESIGTIKMITKRHTGEYCIRPFIIKYPDETLAVMEKWSHDRNVHVRRLASEGLRPRLPWANKLEQFVENPQPILEILNNLKDDDSKFVQKSVANNLNDILKDNYEIGINEIKKWAKGANPNRKWIIKHALRNLVKKKNPEARKILDKF